MSQTLIGNSRNGTAILNKIRNKLKKSSEVEETRKVVQWIRNKEVLKA